jgi:heptosyltransferase-2
MRNLRILIIRPDRIGDVILSTPIPREIKKNYPESYIAVLVRDYTKDVYLNNPYVDKIITLNEIKNKLVLKEIKTLRDFNFSHALMLLPAERLNWILFLSGIKYRIGVGYKFFQFVTNTKSIYRNKYIPLRHEADYCLDMVRKLDISSYSFIPEIFLNGEEIELRNKIRESFAPNGELLVGINSSSGNSAPNMKASEYKKLIEKLLPFKNVKVFVTDSELSHELKNIDGVTYPNLNKSLRESIINFSALDLLISASTGPMHIAAALKLKTISLFCPTTACSPELWGPLGNNSTIILPNQNYHGVVCSGDPKNCFFEGTGGIDADKVFDKVKEFILAE